MVTTRPTPLTRVKRISYRLASGMIQLDRRLRSSHGRGVKVIVCSPAGEILLVSHTYGNRHWTLPGGGVHTDEKPAEAAAREVHEELAVTNLKLVPLGTYPARSHRRTDVISVFVGACDQDALVPRSVEINAAVWVPENDVPAEADPNVATAIGLWAGHRAEQVAANRHAT